MDITFNCGNCGQHIVVDEAGTGLSVPCPKCGVALTVPQIASKPRLESAKPSIQAGRPNAFLWQLALVAALAVVVLGGAVVILRQDRKIKTLEQRVIAAEAKQATILSELETAKQTSLGAVGLARLNQKRMEDQRREDQNRANANRLGVPPPPPGMY